VLDAIIISDTGSETYSASSPLRLQLDGKTAWIQTVRNYLSNNGQVVAPVKGEHENNWHDAPRLNGIRLLSYLQANGFEVKLIGSYYDERDHFINILNENPKVVIISTTFITNKDILRKLVNDIRSFAVDIFIIAGGPLVLSSYLLLQRSHDSGYDIISPKEDFLFLSNENRPDIDLYIVDKGGEQILSEALGRIKEGRHLNDLPNTARWKNNEYVFSERKELSLLTSVIDWKYIPENIFRSGVINVQTSVGCPYNCEFCNFIKDRKHTFIKPLDQLVKELKDISDRGIEYVRFVDDNFRLGRNDLGEVCRRFIKEGLSLKWMSFIRASTLDKTDLKLLKKAGCVETQIGIESADRTVLKNMNKHADPEMYFRVVSNLLETGISCSTSFIVGFPGETEESFKRTVDFIESVPKDSQEGLYYWSIYPFFVAPLSPIYEPKNRAKYNLKGYMDKWEHSTMISRQAYEHIKNAFLKIENASPIYSGDNIDMLTELSIERRKQFMKVRHDLSKRLLKASLDNSLVINSFSPIFHQ
jgi:p-methyltransferase